MPGVTPEGFEVKTLAEILERIVAAQKASPEIGPDQDYSEHGALGQINGVMAGALAELWELAEAVYQSFDPEAATFHSLDVLSSLTGTARRAATHSTVVCVVDFDAGTTIPPQARISVTSRPDVVFELDPDLYPDGFTHAGDDTVSLTFRSSVTGPVSANAGTLTVIDTVTTGWNSVTNPADAVLGRVADGDITLRQRRVDALAKRGGSTVAAIRADLLDSENRPELEGIAGVVVLENETDEWDAQGLPPHSFEVVIDDGVTPSVDNDAIAQAIHDTKPAGIPAQGLTIGTATDAAGDPVPVRFNRCTALNIWVEITVEVDPDEFPVDGVTQIENAIITFGNSLQIGGDVKSIKVKSAALTVPGVVDITAFLISTSSTLLTDANIPAGIREKAFFASNRIDVTVV